MNPENLRLSRRELIVGAAGLGLGAAATQADRVMSRFLPSIPEAQDLSTYGIYNGVIAIHREASLRTSPRIPNRTRLKQPSNTIDWRQIHYVNKTEFPNVSPDAFVISNPELVHGQPTEVYARDFPWSPWIKMVVSLYNGENMFAYVSLNGGRPNVEPLDRGLTRSVGDGVYIRYEDIGEILIPSSVDRLARDTVPKVWAKEVAGKLGGIIPLRPRKKAEDERFGEDLGERIVSVAEVVAAGDTLEERLRMENEQTPVNVRNHPGKFYYNDEPVEILGTVRQGTEIRNLLVDHHFWWSACKRSDIKGELYDQSGNPVNIDPNQIAAIFDTYLKY